MSFCRQRLMSWHLFSGFVLPRPNKHQSRAAYILVEEDVRSDISTLFQVTAWCSGSGCRRRRGRDSQDGQNLLSGSSPPFFSPKLLSSPPIRKNKKRILSFSVPSFFFILFFGEKKKENGSSGVAEARWCSQRHIGRIRQSTRGGSSSQFRQTSCCVHNPPFVFPFPSGRH